MVQLVRHRMMTAAVVALCALGPADASADVGSCLAGLKRRARGAGISERLVDEALGKVSVRERVIELDRRQPEVVATFAGYLGPRVTDAKIERGRALAGEHRRLLDQVTARYGVPGRYLLALWGIETSFGRRVGDLPVLDSLATLACDRRRSERFSRQLVAALHILERELVPRDRLNGSWAGAMGNFQFMPTVFLRHAVDFDGDGRRDLWDLPDALASAANLLRGSSWEPGIEWGREVRLPSGFPHQLADEHRPRPLDAWRRLGVRQADDQPLPAGALQAALVLPAGHRGPAFLVYPNFEVLKRWNRSTFFALAVGHLADRIGGAAPLTRPPPHDEPGLSRQTVEALQERLEKRGFRSGSTDGVFGPATRKAIRAFQRRHRLIPDGHPGREVLHALGIAPSDR
jgi:membrane-bound lytic murein transglycosylase B